MNSLKGWGRITLVSCSALLKEKKNLMKEKNIMVLQIQVKGLRGSLKSINFKILIAKFIF